MGFDAGLAFPAEEVEELLGGDGDGVSRKLRMTGGGVLTPESFPIPVNVKELGDYEKEEDSKHHDKTGEDLSQTDHVSPTLCVRVFLLCFLSLLRS